MRIRILETKSTKTNKIAKPLIGTVWDVIERRGDSLTIDCCGCVTLAKGEYEVVKKDEGMSEWSIEKQMIYEKWAWYQYKGYNFDQTIKALEDDKEIDNELLEKVLIEAMKKQK